VGDAALVPALIIFWLTGRTEQTAAAHGWRLPQNLLLPTVGTGITAGVAATLLGGSETASMMGCDDAGRSGPFDH